LGRNAPRRKAGHGDIESSRAIQPGCDSDFGRAGARERTYNQAPRAAPDPSWTQLTQGELDVTFGVAG